MLGEAHAPIGANTDPIDQDDSWKVIDSYFKQNGLVAQQINSFENFLQYSVKEVIKEFRENNIKKER
jgi:DNA-directed RNA polymerase beta subunit